MKTGEHTFREDIYTCALKYRKWNNELRPFRSLKRRVADIFQKKNSFSDDSRGTSTQTLINPEESEEERFETDNTEKRDSVHSDWSDLIPVNGQAEYDRLYQNRKELNVNKATTSNASVTNDSLKPSAPPTKKTVKNIVLVPYAPKPKDWGNWWIRSQHTTSTVTSPHAVTKQVSQEEEKEEEGEVEYYEPHSPYYSPVHPPEFYEDE